MRNLDSPLAFGNCGLDLSYKPTVTNSPQVLLLHDTFTATDGTLLNGRDLELGGVAWSEQFGTWTIISNMAAPADLTDECIINVVAPADNFEVRTLVSVGITGGYQFGYVLQGTLVASIGMNFDDVVETMIIGDSDGTFSFPTSLRGTSYEFILRLKSTTYEIEVNGQIISDTRPSLSSPVTLGLYLNGFKENLAIVTIDDFEMYSNP